MVKNIIENQHIMIFVWLVDDYFFPHFIYLCFINGYHKSSDKS